MTSNKERADQEGGFSLTEMIIALGVFGMMMAVSLPNLNRSLNKSRVIDATRSLQGGIQYARMAGIKERHNFVVQFLTGRTWNIFSDTNNDGVRQSTERWVYNAPFRLPGKVRFSVPTPLTSSDTPSIATEGCKCAIFRSDGLMESSLLTQSLTVGNQLDYLRMTLSTGGSVKVDRWNSNIRKWE